MAWNVIVDNLAASSCKLTFESVHCMSTRWYSCCYKLLQTTNQSTTHSINQSINLSRLVLWFDSGLSSESGLHLVDLLRSMLIFLLDKCCLQILGSVVSFFHSSATFLCVVMWFLFLIFWYTSSGAVHGINGINSFLVLSLLLVYFDI